LLVHSRKKFSREETIEWLLSHTLETKNGCLEFEEDFWWSFGTGGYPKITWRGRNINICRLICFEDLTSPLVTRHRCHNKSCINPDHLICGTTFDNWHDNKYPAFEMPDSYESIFSIDHEDEWWQDPSDEELEEEYQQELEERVKEYGA